MASMTQDFARMADGIASNRRSRIEAGSERGKAVRDRHTMVEAMLKELRTSRLRATHAHHVSAVAAHKRQRAEVHTMLNQFRRHRESMRRHYLVGAATFMRDLTAGVAALLDTFSASRRERMETLNEQFTEFRRDRRGAEAAWRGAPAKKSAGAQAARAAHQRSEPAASTEAKPEGSA